MDERELREWIARVKEGSFSRREFTRVLAGLGLAAPMAAQVLAVAGLPRGPRPRRSPRSPRPAGAAGAS